MQWTEARRRFPAQWLLIEALRAHSEAGRRELDDLAVVETCAGGAAALRTYLHHHREAPERELYVIHTDREDPDIGERAWLGLRPAVVDFAGLEPRRAP